MADENSNELLEINLGSLLADTEITQEKIIDDHEEKQPLEDRRTNYFIKEQQYKLETLEHQVASLAQANKEQKQSHKLRKRQLRKLFWITLVWISLLWLVILLQGFKGWFFPIPKNYEKIPFQLDKAELIGLITTTTATVLGLYTIAAMWLFGKPKSESKESNEKSDNNK